MGRALYRKYRSKSLDEIVGQEHITDILRRAIAQNKVAHAYLLTGPRGVGKTSIARILAHEINGLPYSEESSHLDIIEIDAASNNGVEDVRDLREKVQIAPSSASKKIYIIDEVHMLSKPAFNALLKTLEEPPEHVVFILATTDVDKLPATIISRVQRFTFRSISQKNTLKHLRFIADKENILIDDEALESIARHGDGSFRDSISLLDQISSAATEGKSINRELIEKSLGLSDQETIVRILEAHNDGDITQIVNLLETAEHSGISASVLSRQIIGFIRNNISENSHHMALLDGLMDVGRASFPYVKLLITLAPSSPLKPVAKEKPTLDKQPRTDLPIKESPKPEKTIPTVKTSTKKPEESIKQPEKKTEQPSATKSKPTSGPIDIDWSKIIESARETGAGIGMLDLLKKCVPVYENNILKLYAGGKFHKSKLDKQISELSGLLLKNGYEVEIQTIGSKPPAKDSQAAAIIAMMGGGEEVNAE